MTPNQIKNLDTIQLLTAYKAKARCQHSARITRALERELKNRLPETQLTNLWIEKSHLIMGEGDENFNDEVDNLISIVSEKNS